MLFVLHAVLWKILLMVETPPIFVPLIYQKRLTKSIILLFFSKLMKRDIPNELLTLLERWLMCQMETCLVNNI